jgi:tetratricopeptide (TPR) repeat protein/tRNA A-37 threonylcarbamoyl transferase component Bud32
MSQPAADRNLLFGILALQADLISRDALIVAMNAWTVTKDAPLGQILREQGALDEDGHALVEALVRRSLDRHQGDAEQSLAALSALGSARQELEQIADAEVQASLAQLRTALTQDYAPRGARAAAVGRPTSSGQRFRILRPHARGGLGEVFVARDEELHREVALKEIQAQHADRPDSRARFLLEAEITGGLEHPHIVPVYGLGHYPDGRPYYAMRFIRGDSLKDAITRFHQADTGRRDPGERALELRQLLGRFVAVCNAVAYAHSRGVLHRDLKPANVMLGKYGETLVVDWGLAKVIGQPEGITGTEEGALRPSSSDSAEPTRLGSAVGTPAFMSPEQAAGRLDELGPASDVYSLGATLYHLLTGRPPFTKDDAGAVLQRVGRGEFPLPRQVKGGVPAALEAICLKAMALRPQERYGTPLALVDEVQHWLADEPVRAYREPWTVRLGRWRRRHRALVAGAAAAALVALLLGGIGLFWRLEQAAELRHGVEAGLDRAADLRREARWAEAEAVLEQADDRLGEGGPQDLRRRLARAQSDLELVRRLDAARLKAATVVEGKLDRAGAARDYAAAFRQARLGRPGDEVAAVAQRLRRSDVREQLVAALDDWATLTGPGSRRAWLLAVARRADPDPWRDRFRDPRVWQDRGAVERLARQARVEQLSPPLLTTLASVLKGVGGDAVPLLTAAQGRYPQDFWLTFEMGKALRARRQTGEAVGYYRAALALRPNASAVHNNLGNALKARGQLDQAVACFQKAIELDPGLAQAHNNLGIVLQLKGRLDAAMACFRKTLAIDPRLATAHNNLGNVLRDRGRPAEAVARYRQALALDGKLAAAHHNLGLVLQARGELNRAVACYRRALALDGKLASAHYHLGLALENRGELDQAIACYQKVLALEPGFAAGHNNLGTVLGARGRLEEAIACFRKATALDPRLALGHNNLGQALHVKGRLEEARACYEKAVALDPRYVGALFNLGNVLRGQARLKEAIVCYEKALALDPGNARVHTNLGHALKARGDLDRAVACFQKAVALDPRLALAHGALGQALLGQGRFRRARDSLRRCLQLLPPGHHLRPLVSQLLGQSEGLLGLEARLPALLQGREQPASAAEHLALAGFCRLKRWYAAAARFHAAAFAADPALSGNPASNRRYPAACCAALAGSGRGEEAGVNSRERARWRRQALDWLRADLALWTGQLESGPPQARTAIRQALRHWQGSPDLAGLREEAGLAWLPAEERQGCRRLWAGVEALLQKAMARP